jgi:hypothetical protein
VEQHRRRLGDGHDPLVGIPGLIAAQQKHTDRRRQEKAERDHQRIGEHQLRANVHGNA